MNIPSVNTASAPVAAAPRQARPDNVATTREPLPVKVPNEETQTTSPPQTSQQQLEEAVKSVSDFVKTANNSLEFSVDKETGVDIVKVIDSDTQKVIRQIPTEEIVAIAKALDNLKGLLIHQKA